MKGKIQDGVDRGHRTRLPRLCLLQVLDGPWQFESNRGGCGVVRDRSRKIRRGCNASEWKGEIIVVKS